MVINIPCESEASNINVISSFPIDEEEEIQSPKVQEQQKQPKIDPMARTHNQHIRGDGHATIPTPGSCVVPNPTHRIPIPLGPQQAAIALDKEIR